MTIALILASWILILVLVTALCVAARHGDLQNRSEATPRRVTEEPELIAIPVPAGTRLPRRAEPAGQLVGARSATG